MRGTSLQDLLAVHSKAEARASKLHVQTYLADQKNSHYHSQVVKLTHHKLDMGIEKRDQYLIVSTGDMNRCL